jgi:hypothetical protein
MDILASIFAYLAGIGALFAGLAVSFFVFFAHPQKPLQPQLQSPSAMLMRSSTPNKPMASEVHAKQNATQGAVGLQRQGTAAGAQANAQPTATAQKLAGKHAPSAAQAHRLLQEERARRWAYHQQPSFESRFLGYAD